MIPPLVLESIPHRRSDSQILESLRPDDIVVNPISGGLSQNAVFFAQVGSGTSLARYAIRSWESATYNADRILQILAFQSHLTEKQIVAPKPIRWLNQQWIIPYEMSFWTIESWIEGRSPSSGSDVSDQLLFRIVDCLTDLHSAGRAFGTIQHISPGIDERIQKIATWKEKLTNAHAEKLVREVARFNSLVNVSSEQLSRMHLGFGIAVNAINQLASFWIHELKEIRNRKPVCHWIIRDLWRSNILVDNDRIIGIVDFGASRIDWPVIEFVRCLSSFLQPQDSRWQAVLDRYNGRSLGHEILEELEIVCMLDHVATTLSLLYWYDWLTTKDVENILRQKPAIWNRVDELAIRLADFPN